MNRARSFFSNLTGDKVAETSEIKEEMGDYSLQDLDAIVFPITRAELLEVLERNGSSNLLIDAIRNMKQDVFDNPDDLRSKLPVEN